MSSVVILKAPVVAPEFGAATLICEWRKGDGYRTGIVFQTARDESAWLHYKTYAKLSTALNAAGRIAQRCERGR